MSGAEPDTSDERAEGPPPAARHDSGAGDAPPRRSRVPRLTRRRPAATAAEPAAVPPAPGADGGPATPGRLEPAGAALATTAGAACLALEAPGFATGSFLGLAGGLALATAGGLRARRAIASSSALARTRGREAEKAREQARRAGSVDRLSGLPNRDGLIRTIDLALRRHSGGTGLVLVELSRFAQLTDLLGPQGGQDVLQEVARRLRAALPADDVVARVATDRFAVLPVVSTDERGCTELARRLAAAIHEPLVTDTGELSLNCAIGVAVAGPHVRTAEELMHAADEAVRVARTRSRTWVAVADAQLRAEAAAAAKLELQLRRAVSQDRISTVYQPIQVLGRERRLDKVAAVEALARWQQAEGTRITPDQFVPLADDIGVGPDLGLHIVDTTLDTLVAWRQAGYVIDQVWVNLAPSQLADPELAGMISARLSVRGLEGDSLVVEVAAAGTAESPRAKATLAALRAAGVGVALDHFGVAGTSLTGLRDLPVTAIKLDPALAADFAERTEVARAVVDLGRSLGLRVIAPGIESEAQLEGARELGVDAVQGYVVASPMTASEVAALLPADRAARIAAQGRGLVEPAPAIRIPVEQRPQT